MSACLSSPAGAAAGAGFSVGLMTSGLVGCAVLLPGGHRMSISHVYQNWEAKQSKRATYLKKKWKKIHSLVTVKATPLLSPPAPVHRRDSP